MLIALLVLPVISTLVGGWLASRPLNRKCAHNELARRSQSSRDAVDIRIPLCLRCKKVKYRTIMPNIKGSIR